MNDAELIVQAIESLETVVELGIIGLAVIMAILCLSAITNAYSIEKAIERLRRNTKP